jgi:6-phospho-beta-glucosidase
MTNVNKNTSAPANNHPFPKGFYWGNSTSSMQTEGAWNLDGKGLSVYDIREAGPDSSDWKDAIDEYHRYKEDIALMRDMNMNMYRFQISWSRVNPTGDDDFNEAGFAYYDNLIESLLQNGIKPMICLYHFDMPLALAQKYNGFLSREVMEAFVRFGKEVVDRYANKVEYWITFNEHNLYFSEGAFDIGGYIKGERTISELYTIFHHTMLAHAHIASYIHENYPDLKIGGMLAYAEVYPATSKPEDILAARKIDEFLNYSLLDAFVYGAYSNEVMQYVKNAGIDMDYADGDDAVLGKLTSDFLAFSYYRSDNINADKIPCGTPPNLYLFHGIEKNRFLEASEWGWQIDPLGFRDVISKMYNRYKVPVFPIENGIGLDEKWDGAHEIQDDERIKYHKDHILAMRDAIEIDGAEVLGYLGWGLIDIPSSSGNMNKRYGAVWVNRTNHQLLDGKRTPKKSFHWFKEVFGSNGAGL